MKGGIRTPGYVSVDVLVRRRNAKHSSDTHIQYHNTSISQMSHQTSVKRLLIPKTHQTICLRLEPTRPQDAQ